MESSYDVLFETILLQTLEVRLFDTSLVYWKTPETHVLGTILSTQISAVSEFRRTVLSLSLSLAIIITVVQLCTLGLTGLVCPQTPTRCFGSEVREAQDKTKPSSLRKGKPSNPIPTFDSTSVPVCLTPFTPVHIPLPRLEPQVSIRFPP